jgi:drug/metabolite transporter (DMT)-like permease
MRSGVLTHSASLYLSSVLIWGSTSFAIKFQLGVVAAEVSLVYRFGIAAILLLLFCLFTGRDLKYSPSPHISPPFYCGDAMAYPA